jgi:putative sigma-54 modulation protein
MDMVVKGRHMDVSPELRTYAEEKIGKLGKILESMIMSVEVELYHERNRSIDKGQVAEVTVYTKGPVIRARESATEMRAAIDLVAEKLETQARKLKGKLVDKHSGKPAPATAEVAGEAGAEDEIGEPEPSIVKTKSVDLKPMTTEEAMLQLELLGHDFLLFSSAETDLVSVLYRRRDGDYGLIEPRL